MDMIIVSPFEANCLLSKIHNSTFVTLHMYAPRQNEVLSSLDKLDLYNVPPIPVPTAMQVPEILRIQLNLFAGQLYLESYSDYQEICDFLGVASVKTTDDLTVAADGFIINGNQGSKKTFSQSPLKFLAVLMSQMRKDCQNIDKTHLGQILSGRLLSPSDFEKS